ncbi:hypothetical protein BGZ65_006278, partial [Modicella reniformis]
FSSKRSSIYGGVGGGIILNGDRHVAPSIEDAGKDLVMLSQDVNNLRDMVYQEPLPPTSTAMGPSLSSNPSLATSARMSTSRRPVMTVTTTGREREEGPLSARISMEGKYRRDTRPQHGRSASFDSIEPNSPKGRSTLPFAMTPVRGGGASGSGSGGILNKVVGRPKPNAAVYTSPSATIDVGSGPSSSQYNKTSPSSSTYRRAGNAVSSQPMRSSRAMLDPEPDYHHHPRDYQQHHRTTSFGASGRSSLHRGSSQPPSPRVKRYTSSEERYHSGSSGQSEEFSGELAYDHGNLYHPEGQGQGQHHYQFHNRQQPPASHHQHHQQQQQQRPYQDVRRQRHQDPQQPQPQQQQQQRQQPPPQPASSQYTPYIRQPHDGSLIHSDCPLSTDGSSGESICPAQIRPKELRLHDNIVESYVLLSNRSRRLVRFEILQPKGIKVTPSDGFIKPESDQQLTVHVGEHRGPGRVVVELDGEWLVPFGISFK